MHFFNSGNCIHQLYWKEIGLDIANSCYQKQITVDFKAFIMHMLNFNLINSSIVFNRIICIKEVKTTYKHLNDWSLETTGIVGCTRLVRDHSMINKMHTEVHQKYIHILRHCLPLYVGSI